MRLNLPLTGDEELREVELVLRSGYLTQGPKAAEFEALVSDFVGTAHAFATSSCTTAMHLCLTALGVGPGDDVVVPDFTYPATANAVLQLGARPILVDIDLPTFNLDPTALANAITERTRAVVVVHAFGLCADMDAIRLVTDSRQIPVIEDAACALGSRYRGRAAGTMSSAGCFSFHPRKIITTGEGGMIMTDESSLAARITVLRNQGGVRDDLFLSFEAAGFNYRMSDVNAAIGIAQMSRLPGIIGRRRDLARQMHQRVGAIPGVAVPREPPHRDHTYQSYVVLLDDDLDRDQVIRYLRSRGIETTLGTYALHRQPYLRDSVEQRAGRLESSRRAFAQSLTLPLYPQLAEADLDRIAESLSDAVAAQRSGPGNGQS